MECSIKQGDIIPLQRLTVVYRIERFDIVF